MSSPAEGPQPADRSVQWEATTTFAYQVAGLIAGALTNIVIARTLGPGGKGILALLGYALFIAISLGGLGLQAGSVYLIGKGRFAKGQVSAGVLLLSLLAGLLCAGAMALVLPRFRATVPLTAMMIGLSTALVIPSLIRQNLGGLYLALNRINAFNQIQTVPAVLWMIGAFVLLVPLHGGIRDAVILWAAVGMVGSLAGTVGALAIAPPRTQEFGRCVRACLGTGLPIYAANLVWILVLRIDGFFLAAYRSAAEVGTYSVAVLIAEVLLHLPRSMALVLTRRFAAGALLPAARLAARASRVGSQAVLLSGIGLAVLSGRLVPLIFGRSFAPSVPPLLWLLPGILALSVAAPLSLYLVQQRGKPFWPGIAAVLGLVANVLCNLAWIPGHGAVGAAWASSVAYTVHAVTVGALFCHETGQHWSALLVPRREDLRAWIDLLLRFRGSSV